MDRHQGSGRGGHGVRKKKMTGIARIVMWSDVPNFFSFLFGFANTKNIPDAKAGPAKGQALLHRTIPHKRPSY